MSLYDRQIRALQVEMNQIIQELKIQVIGDNYVSQEIFKHLVLLGISKIQHDGQQIYHLTSKTEICEKLDDASYLINCTNEIIDGENVINIYVKDQVIIISKKDTGQIDLNYIDSNIVGGIFFYWFIEFVVGKKKDEKYEIKW